MLQPWLNGTTNPRYERYKLEGKQYGARQVHDITRLLKNHVIDHPILKKEVHSITRGDALDFRKSLSEGTLKGKPRTVNKLKLPT
jgi:hypothetical protein